MDASVIVKTIVWWGFGLGIVFGFVANKTNFCTMGAVSDVVNMGHWGRMRAWLLAIAVAMIGTNLIAYNGYLDLSKTIYTGSSFPWLAYIVGGLCFGVGMTLASGCANRTLVRVGGGNLRSVVVFIYLGFAALVTLRGILGEFRVKVLQAPAVTLQFDHSQTLSSLLSGLVGVSPKTMQLGLAVVIGIAILIFVFKDSSFRKSLDNNLAGLVVGLLIIRTSRFRREPRYAGNDLSGHQFPPGGIDVLCRTHRLHPGILGILDRCVEHRHLRRSDNIRRRHRVFPVCADHQIFPLGSVFVGSGHVLPYHRRHTDGVRRRDRDGLHDRPGHHRCVDIVAGFLSRACVYRRRFRHYDENTIPHHDEGSLIVDS
jgi:uncharacterized membrane protein YedE/YeeE